MTCCIVVRGKPSHGHEYFTKFGRVVFAMCERTDRQTDRVADRNTSHLSLGEGDIVTTNYVSVVYAGLRLVEFYLLNLL